MLLKEMHDYKLRFAPAPTGPLHIGSIRTMIFNYVMQIKLGGKFILRIDDTDQTRVREKYISEIYWCANYFDIKFDYIFAQSTRDEIYDIYFQKLVEKGLVYRCDCPAKVVVSDFEADCNCIEQEKDSGAFKFKASKIDPKVKDYIIRTALGRYLYLFTSSVDDIHEKITHIIRGVDHVANLPKQMTIFTALEAVVPEVYHLGLIHDPTGRKLSKSSSDTSFRTLVSVGIPKTAMLNFLLQLGWSDSRNMDYFQIPDVLYNFDKQHFSQSAIVCNYTKLSNISHFYLKNMSKYDLFNGMVSWSREFDNKIYETLNTDGLDNKFYAISEEVVYRSKTYSDAAKQAIMLTNLPTLIKYGWTNNEVSPAQARALEIFKQCLSEKNLVDRKNKLKYLTDQVSELTINDAYKHIRTFVIGTPNGIDPFIMSEAIGDEEMHKRLNYWLKPA